MERYNLSIQQEEMWIAEQLFSKGNLWSVAGYSKLDKSINLQILAKASFLAINSFSNFKARFLVDDDGYPYQIFEEMVACDCEFIDNVLDDKKAIEWMQNKTWEPMFVSDEKLIYVAIIISPATNFYFIKAHHLLFDLYGINITTNRVMDIYSQLINNQVVSLYNLDDCDYKDYLRSQKEYIGSSIWEKDKEYWEDELCNKQSNINVFSLIDKTNLKSKVEFMFVNEEKKEALRELAISSNVSEFVLWLYLISETFCRIYFLDSFCLGVHLLNRTNKKQRSTPGLFVNTLPINISNQPLNLGLVNISKKIKEALRHQQFPISKLSLPAHLYSVLVSFQTYNQEVSMRGYLLTCNEAVCPLTFFIDYDCIRVVYQENVGKDTTIQIINSLWKTIDNVLL